MGSFLDQPGELSMKIDSNQLKLADLMAMFGDPIDLAATVDAEVEIGGALDCAHRHGKTRSPPTTQTQCRRDCAGRLECSPLIWPAASCRVDGTLKHPDLEPITIKGHTPMRVQKIADQTGRASTSHSTCRRPGSNWPKNTSRS